MPIEARGAQCIATPSVIASLLHEFASQDAARCVLPSLACVVRPLTVGCSESYVHLLIFDITFEAPPGTPERLILKHTPTRTAGPSRECRSYASIVPLIDRSTAVFPRVWACYVGPLGEAMLLEAIEVKERSDPVEADDQGSPLERPLVPSRVSARVPPTDPARVPSGSAFDDASSPPVSVARPVIWVSLNLCRSPGEALPALRTTNANEAPAASPLCRPLCDMASALDVPTHTAEDCRSVLRALARFHAPFLGNDDLLSSLAAAPPFLVTGFAQAASSPVLQAGDASELKQRYAALPVSVLSIDQRDWLDMLIDDAPAWRATCARSMPRTLLHGDAQMGNFLFREVADGAAHDEVVFVEAHFAIGPPTLDVSFFLAALWATYAGRPPLDASQALEAYFGELARLGVDWLRTESEAELVQRAETFGRCVQLEAAVVILWRTIDFLEKMPEMAAGRFDAVLDHLKDLEPRCRETVAKLDQAGLQFGE